MSSIPKIDSPLIRNISSDILESIRGQIANGEINTLEELRVNVYNNFIYAFSTVGDIPFKAEIFKPFEYKNNDIYNNNQIGISLTLDRLFAEARDHLDLLMSQFSVFNLGTDNLIQRLNANTNQLKDIKKKIRERQFIDKGKAITIISDDFVDGSKIDFRANQGNQATVDFSTGTVSLGRETNQNLGDRVISVKIINSNHTTDVGSTDTSVTKDGLPEKPKRYEGNRFDFVNLSRPQTGSWKIETKNNLLDKADPELNYGDYYSTLLGTPEDEDVELLNDPGGEDAITKNEITGRLTPEAYADLGPDTDPIYSDETGGDAYANVLTREDLVYVETNPSEQELLINRLNLFDNDPRTFWEIEYTPIITEIESTIFTAAPTYDDYAAYQEKAETLLAGTGYTKETLEFTLEIELDNDYSMSYIDLLPFYFNSEDAANFEIVGITTQDSAGTSTVIDGVAGEISTTSNEKLTANQIKQSGVANPLGYKAKGFWSFPQRTVKKIYIAIKQDTPIANPYQLKNVQILKKTNYAINESKSKSAVTGNGFQTDTSSSSLSANALERGKTTRLIRLGYLETILDGLSGGANTGLLAGTTSGDNFGTSESNSTEDSQKRSDGGVGAALSSSGSGIAANALGVNPPNPKTAALGVGVAAAGAIITALLKGGGGGSSSGSSSKSFNDTGFAINQQFMQTLWQRGRYAVGIRDIGLYKRSYIQTGSIITMPNSVSAGKKTISMEVVERIPPAFLSYSAYENWIAYYLVINGKEVQIQPTGSLSSGSLPTFINEEFVEPAEVKVKIVFKRPTKEQVNDADSLTALLSRYSLIIEHN